MDGYQVAKRIRKDPDGRHMLLVALTGWGFRGDSMVPEDGFDYHLVKPVDPDHLARLLSEHAQAFQRISP
jgi:CheY-like chemotaxis protein